MCPGPSLALCHRRAALLCCLSRSPHVAIRGPRHPGPLSVQARAYRSQGGSLRTPQTAEKWGRKVKQEGEAGQRTSPEPRSGCGSPRSHAVSRPSHQSRARNVSAELGCHPCVSASTVLCSQGLARGDRGLLVAPPVPPPPCSQSQSSIDEVPFPQQSDGLAREPRPCWVLRPHTPSLVTVPALLSTAL